MRLFGLTALRWCVAAVFVAHGAQKLFGVWGGPGLSGTSSMLAGLRLPYPYPAAVVLALTEFAGGILLILGSLTPWVSLALAVDQSLALWKVHSAHGFFLNWSGAARQGHGMEFSLVLLGALVCLLLSGPGALSLDEWRSQSAEARARGRARARNV
jgi:putative oxidoreductase